MYDQDRILVACFGTFPAETFEKCNIQAIVIRWKNEDEMVVGTWIVKLLTKLHYFFGVLDSTIRTFKKDLQNNISNQEALAQVSYHKSD